MTRVYMDYIVYTISILLDYRMIIMQILKKCLCMILINKNSRLSEK